jgi:(2Fe-2S) ferredoxin
MGQYDRHVFVCTSGETCPTQGDVEAFVKALREGVRGANLQAEVRVNKAGCFSQCGHGPMMVVYPENVWYAGVQAEDVQEIVQSHLIGGKPVERLLYRPGKPGPNVVAKASH